MSFVPWYYLSGNHSKMKPGKKQAIRTSRGAWRCIGNAENLIQDYDGLKTMCDVFA